MGASRFKPWLNDPLKMVHRSNLIALLFLAKAIEYFVKAHKIIKGRRVKARLADYAEARIHDFSSQMDIHKVF